MVLVVMLISFGFVLSVCRNVQLTAGLGTIVLLIVFYVLKRCLDFAEKNPEAAIMEGAELLIHNKLKMGSKYHPNIADNSPAVEEDQQGALIAHDPNLPDIPVTTQESNTTQEPMPGDDNAPR